MAKKKKQTKTLSIVKQHLLNARRISQDSNILNMRRCFIDKFTLCDLVCKTIIEHYKKTKGNYKPNEYATLNMKTIPSAMLYFKVSIPKHILNTIFGGSGQYKRRGSKSAKKLRDGIVHAMNENDIAELVLRNDDLNRVMDEFLSFFE